LHQRTVDALICQQAGGWDPFRHDEETQRLLDPMARSAAVAAETQLQVALTLTTTLPLP